MVLSGTIKKYLQTGVLLILPNFEHPLYLVARTGSNSLETACGLEYIILPHLSHPTLVGGLKDDESNESDNLKAKDGRNMAKSAISIKVICFKSLTAVRMT